MQARHAVVCVAGPGVWPGHLLKRAKVSLPEADATRVTYEGRLSTWQMEGSVCGTGGRG